MEAVKEIQYENHIIKIFQDTDYDSCMISDSDDIFLLYYHRNFYITKKGFPKPPTQQTINKWKNEYHLFIVYAYIHSGFILSLSNDYYPFNDMWDVSNCGFVMVKKDLGIEKPKEAAQALINEYNNIFIDNNIKRNAEKYATQLTLNL
jgi:hypothetical protein